MVISSNECGMGSINIAGHGSRYNEFEYNNWYFVVSALADRHVFDVYAHL
jgi:hypothetical protein